MKILHIIAFILLVVGGLNWLLVAFDFNLVETILGIASMPTKVVYVLVGLSAIYLLLTHKSTCKACGAKTM